MESIALARKPFRLWMTGSLAVVMVSLCTARGVLDDERLTSSMRLVRHSPYGIGETAERIEAAVRQRGQAVIARVEGDGLVMVLGSSHGGTPVLMRRPDAVPDVPLSVHLRQAADGGADVLVAQVGDVPAGGWDGLPAVVAEELEALPGLLERALT
jgi:uncharacterized protein (DUF302 family)